MSRRRHCEFCEDERWETIEAGRNASASMEVYPDNGHISVVVQGTSDDGELTGEETLTIEMNFCPVCGRRLT